MKVKYYFIALILILIYKYVSSTKDWNQDFEKAKNYYKNRYGSNSGSKNWHFLGSDISEYPGTDEIYRNISRNKWNDYYECLYLQNLSLGTKRTATPEALVAYKGSFIKLECKICLSPIELSKVDTVVWKFAATGATNLTTIEMNENTLTSPEDKTLHIYNIGEEHSGQYICKLGDALTAPYFVTVLLEMENIQTVHPNTSLSGPYANEGTILHKYNLILFMTWTPWSRCNKCHRVGRKRKFGFCTVALKTDDNETDLLNNVTFKIENVTAATKNINHTTSTISHNLKKRRDQEVKKVVEFGLEYELLSIFEQGIPCKSHIFPDKLKNIPEIENCRDEIMIAYCKENCAESEIYEVRDKQGNVLERVNNSAGIYSMHQEYPVARKPLRTVIYVKKGKDVILDCPRGATDAEIKWKIASKNVIPQILSKQSDGRLFISITDKLHIKKATLTDTNLYSCWQNKELIGTIRLVVDKRIELNFNHHIMLMGMVAIMGTFVYVFCNAYLGRNKKTATE